MCPIASTPAPQEDVALRLGCGLYDRMIPLYTGEVRPQGIALNFGTAETPRKLFDQVAGGKAFDVAELSTSEYISRFAAGQCPFVALPVFPSRVFRHGFITINTRSTIRTPKDLEGKRIGVPLYTMTAAIWIRGHLQHEYGVDLSTIRWVQGAINGSGSHGEPSVMPLVREVDISVNHSGKSLSQLLDEGQIDAIIGTSLPDSRHTNPAVQRLFPDFREVEQDYYRRTGIFPIMHLVAIRKEAYEAHPFIAQSLYRAFEESKAAAARKMRFLGALQYMLPWMTDDLDEMDAVFGKRDPWAYGLEANRKTLETLAGYMVEQGLLHTAPSIDELFIPLDSLHKEAQS